MSVDRYKLFGLFLIVNINRLRQKFVSITSCMEDSLKFIPLYSINYRSRFSRRLFFFVCFVLLFFHRAPRLVLFSTEPIPIGTVTKHVVDKVPGYHFELWYALVLCS